MNAEPRAIVAEAATLLGEASVKLLDLARGDEIPEDLTCVRCQVQQAGHVAMLAMQTAMDAVEALEQIVGAPLDGVAPKCGGGPVTEPQFP